MAGSRLAAAVLRAGAPGSADGAEGAWAGPQLPRPVTLLLWCAGLLWALLCHLERATWATRCPAPADSSPQRPGSSVRGRRARTVEHRAPPRVCPAGGRTPCSPQRCAVRHCPRPCRPGPGGPSSGPPERGVGAGYHSWLRAPKAGAGTCQLIVAGLHVSCHTRCGHRGPWEVQPPLQEGGQWVQVGALAASGRGSPRKQDGPGVGGREEREPTGSSVGGAGHGASCCRGWRVPVTPQKLHRVGGPLRVQDQDCGCSLPLGPTCRHGRGGSGVPAGAGGGAAGRCPGAAGARSGPPSLLSRQMKAALTEIIQLATLDSDPWVLMVADILKSFPDTGSLNLDLEEQNPNVQDVLGELREKGGCVCVGPAGRGCCSLCSLYPPPHPPPSGLRCPLECRPPRPRAASSAVSSGTRSHCRIRAVAPEPGAPRLGAAAET